jgi:methylmalonyl-CoA/ethylmalonyl-CoA epimerase
MMNPKQIEHIGIAVESLQNSIPTFERLLGSPCYKIEEVAEQKVRTAFFRLGHTKIELLEPMSPESPVSRFIEKRGEGIHHIAFAVDDLGVALKDLEAAKMELVDSDARTGAEGFAIAFLHPRSTHGVLIELCERSP